jgi:uncharacterized FlaG/YvyC family protein
MLDNNLLENLNLINNKLDIFNKETNNEDNINEDNNKENQENQEDEEENKENIILIEKFEEMNNEIKNISSNINEKDFRYKTSINPYIVIFTLYIIFIILYVIID